jgi:hypothetical protein
MKWVYSINALGIISEFLGFFMLYKFGTLGELIKVIHDDPELLKKETKEGLAQGKQRIAQRKSGFYLIFIGFVFQLASTMIQGFVFQSPTEQIAHKSCSENPNHQ